jgi:hypothetical protein
VLLAALVLPRWATTVEHLPQIVTAAAVVVVVQSVRTAQAQLAALAVLEPLTQSPDRL